MTQILSFLIAIAPLILQLGTWIITTFISDKATQNQALANFYAAIQRHINDAQASATQKFNYNSQVNALKSQANNPPDTRGSSFVGFLLMLVTSILLMYGCLSFAADNVIGDPLSGQYELVDNDGLHWQANLMMKTNGNGDIFTLGDVASLNDNIIGLNSSASRTLIDNAGKRWPVQVIYTTDGNNNVIPVPAVGGGGSGTVTSVSVASANGLAGSVATATTTPAITLRTTVTGILKGNGTALSAASSGTDYVIPSGSITGTSSNITATSNSTITTLSALSLPGAQVSGNISGLSANTTSASAPLVSSGGTSPNITCNVASGSQPGCLASADWTTFNGKQSAGNYITALTGDLAASGPGSASATIQPLAVTNAKIANATIDLTAKVAGLLPNANVASIPAPEIRYVDFVLGSDVVCPATPCGDGSSMRPWHSLNNAYASVTDESVNKPYTFIISGGNNDPDTGTINAKPNIALFAPYQVQISQPFTVGPDDVGGVGNDVLNYTNITFLYAFTFIKNDTSLNTIFVVNTEFNSGPTLKQNGSGWMFFDGFNVTTNNADFKLGDTGAIFSNPYFNGTTTFEDATASAYYQFMGGYLGGAMSITGAPFVYSSGFMIDVPFGASWTNVHSANGDPTIQFDSAGLPPSVTGAYSSVLTSFSQYVGFTPAASAQWSTVPSTVKAALDSARVLSQSSSGSQPACSSANRGLQWLVDGAPGVADVYQICEQTISGFSWITH